MTANKKILLLPTALFLVFSACNLTWALKGTLLPAMDASNAHPPVKMTIPDIKEPTASEDQRIIDDKNVFMSNRQHPASAKAGFAPLATNDTTLTLAGIVIMGDKKMALIRHDAQTSPLPKRIGEIIDGWTVLEINNDNVLLTQDDKKISINLPVNGH